MLYTGMNIKSHFQFHPWEKIVNGEVVDYDTPEDDDDAEDEDDGVGAALTGMGLKHDCMDKEILYQ